ncbi:uncharacterized protein LOC144650627 [Oculina patagonica]
MFENLIYLNFFLVLTQQRTLAFTPVTENNHVLVGHVFQQLYTRDWFNCIQACHVEPRCISYNYERSAGANGLCELNNCGVKDLCDRDKSLIYSVGFVFQQIRGSKDEDICSLDKSGSSQGSDEGSWWQNGSWSECSVSCGGGIRKRKRICITPPCNGDNEDTADCNVHSCDGPKAPPQFVRAVTKSIHSIGVTWEEVPTSDRSGFSIVNYTVTYYSATQPKKRKSTPMRFVKLTHLKMNTDYTITVQAYNEKGNGPTSVPIYVTISDGSAFQCPLEDGSGLFKDLNSCFHYYTCLKGTALHDACPDKTEFKPSIRGQCDFPSDPYCHV